MDAATIGNEHGELARTWKPICLTLKNADASSLIQDDIRAWLHNGWYEETPNWMDRHANLCADVRLLRFKPAVETSATEIYHHAMTREDSIRLACKCRILVPNPAVISRIPTSLTHARPMSIGETSGFN
jgi:hypothetical protein